MLEGAGGGQGNKARCATNMSMIEQIHLWNQVIVRVLDIRLRRIGESDEIRNYVAPASMFIFSANGHAELWADEHVWLSERFHLLHVGKGTKITVQSGGSLDVYMVLYKASLPDTALREFHMMLQTDNPFMECWGLAPSEPLVLLGMLETMLAEWQRKDSANDSQLGTAIAKSTGKSEGLRRLMAKGEFIRFTHAVLLERTEHTGAPSLAEQVIRYLARNYRETISLEQLAQHMNYTPQYVSRRFKEQMGCSPLDYIIRLRMDAARRLLSETAATLQEAAAYVGYPDTIYFSRMFKKQTGITPGQYRKQFRNAVSKSAMKWSDLSVVAPHPAMYHVNNNDIHYQLELDGGTGMAMSKKKWLAMALLCLTLAASACQASSVNTGGNNGTALQSTNGTATDAANTGLTSASVETRTIKATNGDVEVPALAQRVAAPSYLGTLLALGVKPIASESLLMESPYLEGMLSGITVMGESLEVLLDLEPDLIVTHSAQAETVDRFSLIAPTVAMPYNSFASIQEEMRYFGDLLGKQETAEQWIERFESQTGELRDAVQAVLDEGETVSVMQEYDGTAFLFGPKAGRGGRIMYEILGANPPSNIPDYMLDGSYFEFSLEMLPEYTGDYLILTTYSTLEELQADPIWGNLPAVRNGKVYIWNENQSWYRDPIAVEGQINSLAAWIKEAAKK
ncbi:AraC family transcriptional regulator [Paenibacillus sp. NPDC057967]|uniref:AraC family transcriptional regulator n=1 Tax=Paenibacillus sp. NPDC057967 TaxID=3346293 RepID=UPI0036D97DE5